MAGGSAPDVLESFDVTPVIGLKQGFFLDLMPYIKRDKMENLLRDFVPAMVALMSKGGGVYGFPHASSTGATYFNVELFNEAGLDVPPRNWNWEQFRDTAFKLTKRQESQVTSYGFSQFHYWIWTFPWFVRWGVSFDDPYRVPLATPEARSAARFLRDMVEGEVAYWGWDPFSAGKAGMAISGSWELELWQHTGLSLGIAATPAGPAGKSTLVNSKSSGTSNPSLRSRYMHARNPSLPTRRLLAASSTPAYRGS